MKLDMINYNNKLDPVKVGVAITDIMTGMYSASAIMAALAYRDKCGGKY